MQEQACGNWLWGESLNIYPCASGLMAEPAAYGTNRLHLAHSWAGTGLLEPKVVTQENYFWKARHSSSLKHIILEWERYMLCHLKFANDWLSTSLVLPDPHPQLYILITSPSHFPHFCRAVGWQHELPKSRVHLLSWKSPAAPAESLSFLVSTCLHCYCCISPIPCWSHFKKVILSIWLAKDCCHIFPGTKQAFGACSNNQAAIILQKIPLLTFLYA